MAELKKKNPFKMAMDADTKANADRTARIRMFPTATDEQKAVAKAKLRNQLQNSIDRRGSSFYSDKRRPYA